MAEVKKEAKKPEKKGRPKMKKGSYYKMDGAKLVRKKSCPKCGSGVFMAQHEKRSHCGKCSYTEFK